jgi:alpha-L-fucosidase
MQYKTPTTVIQMLIDIVSKNGNLLLNFPLRADGTLDSQEERILSKIGEWMSINGEAIYGTRTWRTFGEGSTGPASGNFNEGMIRYTSEDIRYTTKDNQLFAFALGWPDSSRLLLRSITSAQVHSVQMLQTGESLKWEQKPDGLSIQLPAQMPGEHATVLRILGVA